MAKQSYKEEIGYSIQYISDGFEWLRLEIRPVEVRPWSGNDSHDVKIMHNDILDYDHD